MVPLGRTLTGEATTRLPELKLVSCMSQGSVTVRLYALALA